MLASAQTESLSWCSPRWSGCFEVRWQQRRSRRGTQQRQFRKCRWWLEKKKVLFFLNVQWVRRWNIIPVHAWTVWTCAAHECVWLGESSQLDEPVLLNNAELLGEVCHYTGIRTMHSFFTVFNRLCQWQYDSSRLKQTKCLAMNFYLFIAESGVIS